MFVWLSKISSLCQSINKLGGNVQINNYMCKNKASLQLVAIGNLNEKVIFDYISEIGSTNEFVEQIDHSIAMEVQFVS